MPEDRKGTYNKGDRQRIWKGSEMKVRRQMSEGRPGGNARKNEKGQFKQPDGACGRYDGSAESGGCRAHQGHRSQGKG